MGTSKANIGPRGNPNPVPEWVPDSSSILSNDNSISGDPEEVTDESSVENEELQTMDWSNVRRSFTAFIKNTSKSNFKKFTSNYKKASGGKKGLVKAAIGGKKGAVILVSFLGSISESGFESALKIFNIGDIFSLKAEGSINKIAEIFSEIDGTDEGSAASSAAIETINKLYNDYIEDPEAINQLDIEQISDYLQFYLSKYIFERISIEITRALEIKDLSNKEVRDIEVQIELYIEAEVNLEFSNSNFSAMNLNDKNTVINEIFENAYSLL